jgi:predicted metal-dependent hydrolase
MSDEYLSNLFKAAQNKYFNKKYKKLEVTFHQFRSLKHTIEWTPWKIKIKVNDHFRHAPDIILNYLAILLLARVYRQKVDGKIKAAYNDYVDQLRKSLPQHKYNRVDSYKAKGNIYDLSDIFKGLNNSYFEPLLVVPKIGWSRKKSYRRLGFYDRERNLLVISKIFDQERVPERVVRYLVYHEMLHIFYPTERKNGRRIIHSKKFKETERQFPQYQEIQNWIKNNLRKL